eukprot:TRINITY_DN35564_c0_g1_i1.p1 TRINITY_DN35564_c0_g1~~TRINITY_DN35564_c0_g1_i1.p1  ORF type:complete len:165 (+),score=33.27 TRINITY_DN35564_c0_g1_i1:70-564(+)
MEKTFMPKSFTAEGAKDWLQGIADKLPSEVVDDLPPGFYDALFLHDIRVELLEPGRIICSLIVPRSLTNSANFLHGGAIAGYVDFVGSAAICTVTGSLATGVSIEMNVSYLDAAVAEEEIEIEAKALRVGRVLAYVTVDLRKKKTGKVVAQGRHTKYLAIKSKL